MYEVGKVVPGTGTSSVQHRVLRETLSGLWPHSSHQAKTIELRMMLTFISG